MKSIKNYLLLFSLSTLFFVSCSSDDNGSDPIVSEPAAYEKGILVTNEGPFGEGSGSITYISDDFLTIEQDVYRNVNGTELGNIVNSMGFAGDDAYIVVNNSQRVMVADRYTFEGKGSISGRLENPRFFAANSTQGYITDWGDPMDNNDDFVAVVDLATNSISSTISVPFGPERIVEHNGKLYVAHQGGWGQNNLVSVISGSSVEKTLIVGDSPNSMVIVGSYLYVLGGGSPDYTGNETAGSLSKIDLNTDQIVETYVFDVTDHPTQLTTDGSQLYYSLNGSVYKASTSLGSLPGTAIIDGFFYALEVNNGKLYATDAGDFASRGSIYVYDLSNNEMIHQAPTGIIPGGIYFNE